MNQNSRPWLAYRDKIEKNVEIICAVIGNIPHAQLCIIWWERWGNNSYPVTILSVKDIVLGRETRFLFLWGDNKWCMSNKIEDTDVLYIKL